MSLTSNNQVLSLPKLQGDSANWVTYSKRILNYLTLKGLCQHVLGTMCKLEALDEHNGSFYKQISLTPLTNEEAEKHEEVQDSYDQMQVAICKVIYRLSTRPHFSRSRMSLMLQPCGKRLHQSMLTKAACTRPTSLCNFRTLTTLRGRV